MPYHAQHHPRRRARPIAICALAFYACGSVSFLRSDSSVPRDRASRFDRFVAEVDLALSDTAPLLDRVRRATTAEDLDSLAWDEERRNAVRRTVIESAVQRLEREFPPSRLDDERAVISRVLLADLAPLAQTLEDTQERTQERILSSTLSSPAIDDPSASLDGLAATPWSGLLVEAPSVLAREHPHTNANDLEAWVHTLESVIDASSSVAIPREAALIGDSQGAAARAGSRRRVLRVVVDSTLEISVMLQASVGAGGSLDPLLGPLSAAAEALHGPDARRFRDASRRTLGLSLASTFLDLVARLEESLTVSAGGVSFRTGPLEGDDLADWIARLRGAVGADVTPEQIQAVARAQIARETREIAALFGQSRGDAESGGTGTEGADSGRAVLRRIRERELEIPGSETPQREPQLLWSDVELSLDELVANLPEISMDWSPALSFERPHGRWSPFVPGNLVPPGDPRARPALYLAPNVNDLTTPFWLHEAEAYRYGVPGRGVLDAYRRADDDVPSILRWTPREAFEEGWGLYAVQMAAENGALSEVDQGFGRHAQELCAHAALLVDIGLHSEGWSRRQSIDFVLEVTPLPESAAAEMVLRCLAHPGRMALPAIGLLRIRALRRDVEEALGDDFDLAEFHGALLEGGPLPVSEMDGRIQRWLEKGTR